MNQYGTRAKQHWQKYLPQQYSHLPDPDSFFSELGDQIADRVQSLTQDMAGDDPPGEGFLQKLGRLNMAKRDAEWQVMQEMALLDPEP